MPKQISKKTKTKGHTVDSLAKDLAQFRKEMKLLWRANDKRWDANDKQVLVSVVYIGGTLLTSCTQS